VRIDEIKRAEFYWEYGKLKKPAKGKFLCILIVFSQVLWYNTTVFNGGEMVSIPFF